MADYKTLQDKIEVGELHSAHSSEIYSRRWCGTFTVRFPQYYEFASSVTYLEKVQM